MWLVSSGVVRLCVLRRRRVGVVALAWVWVWNADGVDIVHTLCVSGVLWESDERRLSSRHPRALVSVV